MSRVPADPLATHLRRPLGGAGVRRVEILVAGAGPPVRLAVGHAWRVEAGECASVLCVLPPGPLAGTAVLMRERPYAACPAIWVRPAGAARSAAVAADRCEDHLLGTDLSYDDIRFWTPRVVAAATSVTVETGPDGPRARLRARWERRGTGPVTGHGLIDAHGLLVMAEVVADPAGPGGTGRVLRRLTAHGVRRRDGVATPSELRVVRPGEGFRSVLTLRALAVGSAPDAALFEPGALAGAAVEVAAAARSAPAWPPGRPGDQMTPAPPVPGSARALPGGPVTR